MIALTNKIHAMLEEMDDHVHNVDPLMPGMVLSISGPDIESDTTVTVEVTIGPLDPLVREAIERVAKR